MKAADCAEEVCEAAKADRDPGRLGARDQDVHHPRHGRRAYRGDNKKDGAHAREISPALGKNFQTAAVRNICAPRGV